MRLSALFLALFFTWQRVVSGGTVLEDVANMYHSCLKRSAEINERGCQFVPLIKAPKKRKRFIV